MKLLSPKQTGANQMESDMCKRNRIFTAPIVENYTIALAVDRRRIQIRSDRRRRRRRHRRRCRHKIRSESQ